MCKQNNQSYAWIRNILIILFFLSITGCSFVLVAILILYVSHTLADESETEVPLITLISSGIISIIGLTGVLQENRSIVIITILLCISEIILFALILGFSIKQCWTVIVLIMTILVIVYAYLLRKKNQINSNRPRPLNHHADVILKNGEIVETRV